MGEEIEILKPKIIETDFAVIYDDYRGTYIVDKPKEGKLPTVTVYSNTIPAAWELALIACWDHGVRPPTHYDGAGDPPSKEISLTAKISNPFNEPRISKRFPGGPQDLEVYRQEVIEGIHDHWINPLEKKWTYTYHERAFAYRPSEDLKASDRGFLISNSKLREILEEAENVEMVKEALNRGQLYIPPINQIEQAVINDLERDRTSKGAQITTWMPTADPGLESNRPCLQRLWFRIINNFLNLNSYWRSRDGSGAWYMNAHAITELQEKVAGILSMRFDEPIYVASYEDVCDSFHIYGRNFKRVEAMVDEMKSKPIEKRVYVSYDPRVLEWTEETRKNLEKDPDYYKKGGN